MTNSEAWYNSSMPIHVLSEQLAAQIAAGEVIERPASVVKELIENAIDAGASEVKVEARDGGKRLVRVSDNGSGIPAADAELAFVHHATSKLNSADDLFAIRTLGFRGEALPSIASVSHMTLLTRTEEEEAGTELKLSGGRVMTREPHAAPRGTLVAVENLFYNVPARLKFLKSTQTEAGHIHELVNRHALAYPSVRFSLVSENRLVFQSSGNGSMSDVLVAVYGIETANQMIDIAAGSGTGVEEGGAQARHEARDIIVNGFVSNPSLSRANRSHMVFFVNGRAVQDRNLTYAVGEAYHTLLQVGRYPLSIVMVQLPPDEVDVNVHPTKAEVRFRDTHRVFSAVQRTVRHALVAYPAAPDIAAPGGWPTPEQRQANLRSIGQFGLDIQRARTDGGSHAFQIPNPELEDSRSAAGGRSGTSFSRNESDAASGEAAEVRRSEAASSDQGAADSLPMLRVLGQVARTYIVAEGPEGIFLIDQHAAHERVLYEKLRRLRLESGNAGYHAQVLLEPLTVELNPQQAARLDEQLDLLRAVGFEIEPFGGTAHLLRSVPAIMSEGDPRQALATILDEMADEREWLRSDVSQPLQAQREAMLIASVCKQGAIKAGRVMNLPEMQELIRQLEQSESPRTCPHGRPTVIRLALDQLARQFGRG